MSFATVYRILNLGCVHKYPIVARATRPPSPATAGGGPAPGSTCVCCHRSVTIAASRTCPVQLARRNCPPRPRPAEGQRRAAHACAATGVSPSQRVGHASRSSRDATVPPRPRPAESQRRAAHACTAISVSRSWRDLHAPCSSHDATALPGHGQRRVSAGPHMGAPPSARRHSYGTCTPRAASATRPPSPPTAGGGPAQGCTCVCLHRRVAIAARPARPVRLARRDRPSQPQPAEGQRRAHMCVPP